MQVPAPHSSFRGLFVKETPPTHSNKNDHGEELQDDSSSWSSCLQCTETGTGSLLFGHAVVSSTALQIFAVPSVNSDAPPPPPPTTVPARDRARASRAIIKRDAIDSDTGHQSTPTTTPSFDRRRGPAHRGVVIRLDRPSTSKSTSK